MPSWCKDIDRARALAEINSEEEKAPGHRRRPIVLVKKKKGSSISSLVAPGMAGLGIMLPYTPVHHILIQGGFTALVMTSANQTDEPICIGNDEAVKRLERHCRFFSFSQPGHPGEVRRLHHHGRAWRAAAPEALPGLCPEASGASEAVSVRTWRSALISSPPSAS